MLVDLPAGWEDPARAKFLRVALGDRAEVERVHQGVYLGHLNLRLEIEHLVKEAYPFGAESSAIFTEEREKQRADENYAPQWNERTAHLPNDYGVADNWYQIIARWHDELVLSDRRFLITYTPIIKANQGPEGGWRWHKWGEYIGVYEPTTEYLYDEPEIEDVIVFHIFEMNDW